MPKVLLTPEVHSEPTHKSKMDPFLETVDN